MNALIGLVGAIVGLGTAIYIFYKKNKKAPLICPRKTDCTTVVTGGHSTTFGVPNDILGIIYYLSFTIIFGLLVSGVSMSLFLVQFIAAIGVLFTVYLIAIQAFVIRLWCMWCLLSALCAVVIFVAL